MTIKTYNAIVEDFELSNKETGTFEVTNIEELFSTFQDILTIFEMNNEKDLREKIREEVKDEVNEKIKRKTQQEDLDDLIEGYQGYENVLWNIDEELNKIGL